MIDRAIAIRPVEPADLAQIAAIYRQEVLHGTATFELEAPGAEAMAARYGALMGDGYPWLAALAGEAVAGYAHAAPFRPRPAFRHTVENSVYVAPAFQRRGVGGLLLAGLIEACEERGFRQMIAVIGDGLNDASIRMHARAGFTHAGVWKSVGWKFGRWLDCVAMQRALGAGDSTPANPRADG